MTAEPDDRPHVDPPTTRIRLRRNWDAALERTARLRPARCHAALLDWRPERWPADGGMPVEIALALATALTSLGTVVGRTYASDTVGPCTTLIQPPRRSVPAALRDWVLRRPRADMLAQTQDAGEASAILDFGWSVQSQAILVLSPGSSPERVIEALRYRCDWRDFHLAPSACVLVVPSNDGNGAMIAAPSAAALGDVLALAERSFGASGFPVSRHW